MRNTQRGLTPQQWRDLVNVLLDHLELSRAQVRDADRDAYAIGYADGHAAGYREAHEELAAHWSMIAKNIRANAGRMKGTVTEPAVRSNGIPDASVWFTATEWDSWAGAR